MAARCAADADRGLAPPSASLLPWGMAQGSSLGWEVAARWSSARSRFSPRGTGELGCCSLGRVTHGCPAGAGMAGGLGLLGSRKRQMSHTGASSPQFTAPAFSTYDSPCQELVPERSPFLQAEEDTPCKHKNQTPSQVPQTVGSQHQPRSSNSSQPMCPRPQTLQRGDQQDISDAVITVKPLHCPPPS